MLVERVGYRLMRFANAQSGPLQAPDSANGGYACGLVAGAVDAHVIEVTLHLPPPLEVDLSVDPTADDPFVAHRSLLFTVAYEMLGSAADAEDVVQESWLRWAGVDRSQVRDPRAYLVRIVLALLAGPC